MKLSLKRLKNFVLFLHKLLSLDDRLRRSSAAKSGRAKPEELMPLPEVRMGKAKTVSLAESLEMHVAASERLKEALAKQAADRLTDAGRAGGKDTRL